MEEGGGLRLVARPLPAEVTRFCDVLGVKFRITDLIEDVDGVGSESGSSVFLDLLVGAGFGGPVHEVLADGPKVPAAFVSSCSGHVQWAESVGGDRSDGRELARQVRSP